MSTFFTFLFALACLSTFLCAVREQWKSARLASAAVALLAFLLALATVKVR